MLQPRKKSVQIWPQKAAASQPWSTMRLENADHCKIARKKWKCLKIGNSLLQCNNAKKANLDVFRLQNLGKIFKQLSLDQIERQFWTRQMLEMRILKNKKLSN